jgi:hypothetical protein
VFRASLLLLAFCAANSAAAAPCDESNLLEGRQPLTWRAAYRPNLITDGITAFPGDPVQGNLSGVLGGPTGASIEWDVGAEMDIDAAFLQAGADASYVVEASRDRETWTPLFQAGVVGSSDRGLRERIGTNLGGRGRYLRLRPTGGPWPYAVTELQVFCRRPLQLNVAMAKSTPAQGDVELAHQQAWRKGLLAVLAMMAFIGLARVRRSEMVTAGLAVAGLALGLSLGWTFGPPGAVLGLVLVVAVLVGQWRQARRGHVPGSQVTATLGWLLLAATAPLAYTLFGDIHDVHYHDAAHYFLGAKYAPELGYTGLYRCLVEADTQEARWPSGPDRPVRDLRSNQIVTQGALLADGVSCSSRFSADRWADFKQDAMFFQSQLPRSSWEAVLSDHGYNATPVWTWMFASLLGSQPASVPRLKAFMYLDEAMYAVLLLGLLWGFGLRAGVLAALVIALGFPWIWLWTGGGIGRSVWLLVTLVGLGTLLRGLPIIAGILLGSGAALQVFPGLLFLGPLAGLLIDRIRRQPGPVHSRRLLLAGSSTFLVLTLASLRVAGADLWYDFVRNSLKHMASVSNNRIGLGQLAIIGCPSLACALLGLTYATLLVLVWARMRTTAARLSLSSLLPLVTFNLSSYYLTVLAGAAPLLATPRRAVTAVAILVLLPQMGVLLQSEVPGQGYYAVVSGLYLLAALGLLAWLSRRTTGLDTWEAKGRG